MTIMELEKYLSNLTGHVTFEYNGYSCGIDPLAVNEFDMWYGNYKVSVKSIKDVMNSTLFNGKSLKNIWGDVTNLDF